MVRGGDEMKKNQKPSMSKRRATVAAVLCFVAAIAIAGTYTFSDYKKTQKNELAKTEEKIKQTEETGTSKIKNQNNEDDVDNNSEDETEQTEEGAGTTNTPGTDETDVNDTGTNESDNSDLTTDGVQTTSGSGHNVSFTEDSYILWPVNGAVIMSYSMDKTIYFQTLDQYKYNPAVIIEGAEGDQVLCGAPGIIKSIDVNAQTGTTVNVDIGNGYELLYGQLKEVPVKVGDYVEAKSVLGYVSQPTKYYSKEGCNVYFEMRKDGQPVNPVEYTADQD